MIRKMIFYIFILMKKVDYDKENDILYFYPNEKSVDYSIDYDDIILDVSGNKIVGGENMDASDKFGVGEDIERIKQAINFIKEAYMGVKYGVNSIFVKIGFSSMVPENIREGMLIQVLIKKELILN